MSVLNNYQSIVTSIQQISQKCGRDANQIKLVAVSKGYEWGHIHPAYQGGCRDFGENRIMEAEEKIQQAPTDIHWHFIGSLQKNKVRKAIGKFSLIHSVDSYELAEKISMCSEEAGVVTAVLLQANVSGEPTKHGLTGDAWRKVFDKAINLKGIHIQGWMTMAPFVDDVSVIRNCFAALRELREDLGGLPHLSMGMSHDYPIAIEEGATILRIGSSIFADYFDAL